MKGASKHCSSRGQLRELDGVACLLLLFLLFLLLLLLLLLNICSQDGKSVVTVDGKVQHAVFDRLCTFFRQQCVYFVERP